MTVRTIKSLLTAFTLLAALPAFAQTAPFPQADIRFLLEGVKVIESSGAPGPVAAFGPQAFPVVLGSAARNVSAPVVVASRLGSGRIVAFGHGGFLGTTDKADSGKFLQNSVRWASSRTTAKPAELKVGILRNDGLQKYLKAQGFDATILDPKDWHTKLTGLQVVIADTGDWKPDACRPALDKFIRAGGGLVTAGLGWGWLQLNPDKTLSDHHAGNLLLTHAGILWLDGTLSRTAGNGFSTTNTLPAVVNTSHALNTLLTVTNASTPITQQLVGQASWILTQTAQALPKSDRLLQPQLTALRQRSTGKIPSAKSPLKTQDALERLTMTLDLQALKNANPAQIKAHPAAAEFPGTVPSSAERITKHLVLKTKQTGWHSTGLYAAPGEIIRVSLPTNAITDRLTVRIGCHTDRLWNLPTWSRAPEITTSESLTKTNTAIASAFGGLIYIEIPGNAAAKDLNVTIAGGVNAPRYILGQTKLADWRETIRLHPAPWAELETTKLILSVPASAIRTLDDPEALMKHWDQVMDGVADLATIPRDRKRPERIVPDVQISAGYMHSGYPIMTHLDVVEESLDLKHLTTKGSWGHYHELGHNHQAPEWTFDGTTEVTCNLFSLYTYEKILGLGLQGHNGISPDSREKHLKKYFGTNAKFDDWKRDPFLALTMYYQLIEGFGWDAFKHTFTEYRNLPKEQRPKSDDEERDQWLIRFSRTTGKNLGPFFEAWKIPTSQAARDSVKTLPIWLPEPDFPAKYKTP
ncbi:MAG: M60 family metallopeptidase [Verrucomicrobiota bacterium]